MATTRARVQRLAQRLGFSEDAYLIALAAAIGSVTALGAIGFVRLLEWGAHEAAALQEGWSVWLLPVLPMAGALVTGLLVHFFAREAKGHGVPEVMDAVYRKKGRIRPRVAIVKSLASACTIGSGGSAGAEGPIIQIGAAIGSGAAQLLRVSREHTSTLLGCGAAAGIASVFNAPIAGVFFCMEALLRDFSLRTFAPIVIASVFSAALTQAVLGENEAIFAIVDGAHLYSFSIAELPSYTALGVICGLVAVGFTRSIYAAEDFFDAWKVHPLVKPVSGALALGLLGVGYIMLEPALGGSSVIPPFFGNGYESIRTALDPIAYTSDGEPIALVWAAALILLAKAAATCLTLGSGGSGGVFAPSLFLGAMAGAFVGGLLSALGLLPAGATPASYALVGMAAVVAGATHAPLTAILIVFEITRDEYVLLPIMLAAISATVVSQLFMRDSIYSLKLRRRGVLLGRAADLTILRKLHADSVPLLPHAPVLPEDPVSKLLELKETYSIADFVVIDADGNYRGLVTGQDIRAALIDREAIPLLLVDELVRSDLPTIAQDEPLDSVLDKFSRHDVSSLAVTDRAATGAGEPGKVLGLMTRSRLLRRYQQALSD